MSALCKALVILSLPEVFPEGLLLLKAPRFPLPSQQLFHPFLDEKEEGITNPPKDLLFHLTGKLPSSHLLPMAFGCCCEFRCTSSFHFPKNPPVGARIDPLQGPVDVVPFLWG